MWSRTLWGIGSVCSITLEETLPKGNVIFFWTLLGGAHPDNDLR